MFRADERWEAFSGWLHAGPGVLAGGLRRGVSWRFRWRKPIGLYYEVCEGKYESGR